MLLFSRKRKWDQDDHNETAPATKITKVEADPTKAVSKYTYIYIRFI
jgi:hypothetical protein